jgi:hypothetical protein
MESSCVQWRLHNPMIPHVIVLEPGLVIYKVYSGYWFLGRPTVEDLRQDLRAVTFDPIEVTPVQLISGVRTIQGWAGEHQRIPRTHCASPN